MSNRNSTALWNPADLGHLAAWQAEMAPFFADLPDGRPDRGSTVLAEVFNLDDQLGERA